MTTCDICDRPFSPAEWGDRHTGWGPLDEVHAACCERCGPCSAPIDPDLNDHLARLAF